VLCAWFAFVSGLGWGGVCCSGVSVWCLVKVGQVVVVEVMVGVRLVVESFCLIFVVYKIFR